MKRFAILLLCGLAAAQTRANSAPTYSGVRTDTGVAALPSPLPSWGGLTGAGSTFTDPGFNAAYPPQYLRVTDGNTYQQCHPGLTNTSYGVTSGSGDESIFNSNDTLFFFGDSGAGQCIFGLVPSTMQTGFVYAGYTTLSSAAAWSQTNPAHLFVLSGSGGGIYLVNVVTSGGATCSLGGPTCSPTFTQFYNFVTNCGINSSYSFYELGGVGGTDTIFPVTFAVGIQDSGHQAAALNWTGTLSTSTCYLYNTQAGTVRSYTGAQTPVTGTVNCNGTGTISWVSGSTFDNTSGGGIGWTGVNFTVGGTTYVIASVPSTTTITIGGTCPTVTGASYSTSPGVLLGATTSTDQYSIHNVKIDQSGTWLIVAEGANCYSAACSVNHAWQIGTTTVNNCIYSSGGTDAGRCGGHWTEATNGWFNGDTFDSSTGNPSMLFRTWANFSTTSSAGVTQLNTGNATQASGFDFHPSNKNDPLGTHGYPIIGSAYAIESPILHAYTNEVLGWTQTPGPVLRFGHTFNSAQSPNFATEISVGAPSSTGQYYVFTSDAEGTLGSTAGGPTCTITSNCRSDIFLLNLASPPASLPPSYVAAPQTLVN